MKTHYLSPYVRNDAKNHYSNCGKLVGENMDLANDPREITCKTCLRVTLDYFEAYRSNLYKDLAESVRTMQPQPTGDLPRSWVVSDIKVRGLRATLSLIDSAGTKIDGMVAILRNRVM